MTMVEFLRARLDEDERIARASVAAPWSTFIGAVMSGTPPNEEEFCNVFDDDLKARDDETVEHIARHDPARVLREVEAKRRIIDEHTPSKPPGLALAERVCRTCTTAQKWDEKSNESNCITLRLLALAYADHPDYDEAWRP